MLPAGHVTCDLQRNSPNTVQSLSLPPSSQVPASRQQQVHQAQDGGGATHSSPPVEPHLHLLRPADRGPGQRLPGAHRVGQGGSGQQHLPGRSQAGIRHR